MIKIPDGNFFSLVEETNFQRIHSVTVHILTDREEGWKSADYIFYTLTLNLRKINILSCVYGSVTNSVMNTFVSIYLYVSSPRMSKLLFGSNLQFSCQLQRTEG